MSSFPRQPAAEQRPASFQEFIGLERWTDADGVARVRLGHRPELMNYLQQFHGGVLMSVLDAAMAQAIRACLPDCSMVTIDMATHFMGAPAASFVRLAGWCDGPARSASARRKSATRTARSSPWPRAASGTARLSRSGVPAARQRSHPSRVRTTACAVAPRGQAGASRADDGRADGVSTGGRTDE